ncbi:MAG: GNAT family N-acetyltransferase [Gammaproteobacteria bacterium]|nr:GNAT family N-acetyltransferase [Gammaproteobacteria bacterium]
MLEIRKIESLDDISELRKEYFVQTTAPLDGMWHFGFVLDSDHFGFYEGSTLVGYCCINDEGYVLQFYLSPAANAQATELFALIAQQNSLATGTVVGAFVSTAETNYLSLCLDNSRSFKVNALMYQLGTIGYADKSEPLEMQLADQEQLADFVEFGTSSIGAPEQWLTAYFDNLIQRKELWGYWANDQLLATGECRLFDEYQTEFADLGIIVAKSERGRGLATRVLYYLINKAAEKGLQPICSTERSNIAAQKAITRAGLVSSNRIIQFEFDRAQLPGKQ